jgi:hypothetical protein
MYGCETWSLILKEELRLRVFENRVLRKIFRPKRVDIREAWKRLHNKELYDQYSSPNVIRMNILRKMRRGQAYSTHGERRDACKLLVGIPEGKFHLEDLGVYRRIILKRMLKK